MGLWPEQIRRATNTINQPGEKMIFKVAKASLRISKVCAGMSVTLFGLVSGGQAAGATITPSTLPRLTTIDERFQSYNVEMLEVTGGRFWKPYKDIPKTPAKAPDQAGAPVGGIAATPAGMSPDLYQYRAPIDLTNRRLRMLARALSPAYVRISGTWANTTFFADTDTPPKAPPQGYGGVLTRQQWLAAIDFSRAVNAPIVTSVPNGVGTRGADGLWRPDQARRWLAFTTAHGGTIAAAEYFNEPTMASMGGAPKGYDAAAFGRDFKVFDAFMRKEHPATILLGPGSVGEADAPWAVASGGYANITVLHARPTSRHRRETPTHSPTTIMELYRNGARPWAIRLAPTRRCLKTGWAGPTRHSPTIVAFATKPCRASPSGTRRRRTRPVAAILGPPRSWTRSATSISSGACPNRASRSSCTTRWTQVTTDSWTNTPTNRSRTIGARCFGAG